MKLACDSRICRFASIGATALIIVILAGPAAHGQQSTKPAQAFAKLKTLIGSWDVTERDNPSTKEVATYSMTGGGHVLTEDLRAPEGGARMMGHMFTTYYMDKDQLMLTHYCGAGNQPRMRVTSIEDDGRRIVFEMLDITNLAAREAFHSNAVEVVFLGADRVNLVYHGTRGPGPGTKSEQVFQLSRRTP